MREFFKNFYLRVLDIFRKSPRLRYVVIISIFIGAYYLRWRLGTYTVGSSYLIFLTSIILSAALGGVTVGVIATIFSAVVTRYFFIPPYHSFQFRSVSDAFIHLLFISQGIFVSILIGTMYAAITKAQMQKDIIEQNEKRFQLMVQGLKDYAVYLLDKNGFVVSWNEGAERIKGYPQQEVLGKHFSMFYGEKEIEKHIPWDQLDIAKTTGKFENETWRVRKDGSRFWASRIISRLEDNSGHLIGFVNITRDMTDRKHLEERKDDFMSITSHELKTPLTTIKAFTQLLSRYFKERGDKKANTYLLKVEKQLNNLTGLVNDLLDVSKISSGKLQLNEEVFNLEELITETINNIQITTPKHTLVKRGDAGIFVRADRYRISQVLTNFLTNAIKYSPEAQRVIIKTTYDADTVTVSVQDFGIGIPSDQLEYLFTRFYRVSGADRTSYPGLGLGLYIAADIINRHHGKIWVDSKEGQGSIFSFTLPRRLV